MTFDLPDDFVSSTLATATGTLGTLSPYITLILGVILSAVVVEILINAVRRHN
jgi:hypothetical protein